MSTVELKNFQGERIFENSNGNNFKIAGEEHVLRISIDSPLKLSETLLSIRRREFLVSRKEVKEVLAATIAECREASGGVGPQPIKSTTNNGIGMTQPFVTSGTNRCVYIFMSPPLLHLYDIPILLSVIMNHKAPTQVQEVL